MKMFLVSNGITNMAIVNFIAGTAPRTAADLMTDEHVFHGYCVTAITFPTETGTNTSLIHAANIADFDDEAAKYASLKKSYVIRTTPDSFLWAKDVDEKSELHSGVMRIIGPAKKSAAPEPTPEPAPEPGLDLKKLAKIKDMLESLSPEEIKALTGGK